MRPLLVASILSSLALLASAPLTHASVTVIPKVVTELGDYGVNATYRCSVVNVSLLIITSSPIYNALVVRVINASLLKSGSAGVINSSGAINASLLIPEDAGLGRLNISLTITYYTYPEPTEVCREVRGGVDLYACIYSNISGSYRNKVYVWTYPYIQKRLLIWRNGYLIANTSVTSWVRIKDPYPGPATYNITVISYLGNESLKLVAREAKPTKHYLSTSFTLEVIPRNVTRLDLIISNNSLVIRNPATLNDVGQLLIRNLKIKVYTGEVSNNTLTWVLNKTYVVKCLRANETKVLPAPWNTTKWPFINVTAEVCDDVHGCFIVNSTYLVPLTQLCKDVRFKVVDTHGRALPNALVVLNGVLALTNEDGVAELSTYPLGVARISYSGRVTHELVAGCGEYLVVMDLDPPKVINASSPGPGVLSIEAVDYSPMYVWIEGLGPFGPFNNSITLYLPSIHLSEVHIVIKDSFNNSVSLKVPFKPVRYQRVDYLSIAEVTIPLIILAYVSVYLILRTE